MSLAQDRDDVPDPGLDAPGPSQRREHRLELADQLPGKVQGESGADQLSTVMNVTTLLGAVRWFRGRQ